MVSVTHNDVASSSIQLASQRICFSLATCIQQLKARKPMSQIQEEIDTNNQLGCTLNCIHLIGISLGSLIGAGIFILSGYAAANLAGPSVIISFVITGIVAILTAFSFAELLTMMSHPGAAYTFTYAALGEYFAWIIGWNYTLNYQLAVSVVVVNWSKSLVHLIVLTCNYEPVKTIVEAPVAWNETGAHFYITGHVLNLPAIILTIALTTLLLVGIRATAVVNLTLVIFKIITILIFIFACAKYINPDNYTPFIPTNEGSFSRYGLTGMLQACTSLFFAYLGFDSIAVVAHEANRPMRLSLSFVTIAPVVISLLIYIGISTVMIGLVPYKLLGTTNPLFEALKMTPYGLWLFVLMDLGCMAALATVALTMLLCQTRIFCAMAYDGLLPEFFAKICCRTKSPWISIIISGIFCAVIAGVFPIEILSETTSISALIMYFFVHIEVIVIRHRHPDMCGTFKTPFGSWLIPTLGSILCILLMVGVSKATAYRLLIWTLIGQVIYFMFGFWHSKRRIALRQDRNSMEGQLRPIARRSEPVHTDSMNETHPDGSAIP